MAEDQQPDRNINIQSTVNVGTANDKTTVSGATVKVDSAREVHVHGESSPPPSFRSVTFVGVLAFLSAVLINYATSLQLPETVKDYLWLSWPLAILVTTISIWVAYRQSRSNPVSVTVGHRLDVRNRSRMLDKVENFWIKGVLDQSLYQVARLELGLEQTPDKVDHPWRTVLQETASKREVPAGTEIIELFDSLDGKLLILGAPGAGKTTMLLELARDLITRARQDPQHPIPLVFNLSTWASQRLPLDKWLTIELNQRYDVPSKLATAWVEADAILPLLDGLDEIAPDQRDACVEAINAYRQKRSLVQLAVCSRVEEYGRLADKLRLEGAVIIQPLTQQTVDAYLHKVGRPLAAVRTALKDDPALWELLENPLLLSIVALAYKHQSSVKLRAAGTPEQRRYQLFDDYTVAMFARREVKARFPRQQTTRWLAWLAHQLVIHDQTVYYIERMQLDWLPHPQRQRSTRITRLVVGLIAWMGTGLIFALVAGLAVGQVVALVIGLVLALGVGLGSALNSEFEQIKITETLKWSWSRSMFVSGLNCVLFVGVGMWLTTNFPLGLLGRACGGLMIGLGSGLLVMGGLTGNEILVRTVPNQGIYRSAHSWLTVGLVVGLIGGLASALSGVLHSDVDGRLVLQWAGILVLDVSTRLFLGLGGGLSFGLAVGMSLGGQAVIQHYTLRYLLYRNNSLPFRDLIPFLDYCVDRIFLRRVGGGYIFVHRLVMEYFASLYAEQE